VVLLCVTKEEVCTSVQMTPKSNLSANLFRKKNLICDLGVSRRHPMHLYVQTTPVQNSATFPVDIAKTQRQVNT